METQLQNLVNDLSQEIDERASTIVLGQCDSFEKYRIKAAELHILREIRGELNRILHSSEEDDA